MAIEVFAPAKVNLALHVTGQRDDGYHLLDSLVVFAGVGDRVTVAEAQGLSLTVTGPEGAGLDAGEDNLVMRAARAFGAGRGAAIALEKSLPVASGIGGGSADAAATLRALSVLWDLPLPGPEAVLALGADVPVCLAGHPARMRGIGETVTRGPGLPRGLAIVLVNPRVPVSTPAVFRALARKDNAAIADMPPGFARASGLAEWLGRQRNDLEPPAVALVPDIGAALAAMTNAGARVPRMSGSGATVFGLFDDLPAARVAEAALRRAHPRWWIAAAPVLS
ncbi:MAG: 4-(cytidine 5'-diphospho)-2-C-methyl-D-erythritol kinase [Rhodobacteraceae bacterium]|nr:4-(cytidine 5'-diphospho)-2-C-methyl-D-erythritol kinase [Paracoccaceae bacterium]